MGKPSNEVSRMNGLKVSVPKTDAGPVNLTTNFGYLGAKCDPLQPSNNPGPSTSPSSQGPTRPEARSPESLDK